LAASIARAAASEAPSQAGAIVEAVCRVLPTSFQNVAEAVAQAVPAAGKEILAGVVAALPQLKNDIAATMNSSSASMFSVGTVLAQVVASQNTSMVAGTIGSSPALTPTTPTLVLLPRGPTTGGPIVPITSPGSPIDPGDGGQIPTGDPRGYAAP
jgi:hypothetical protein